LASAGLLVALTFALATRHLLVVQAERAIAAQAELAAAALTPGPDGDLPAPIERLCAQRNGLIAVGELRVSGRLRAIRPDRPSYRQAAATTLEAGPGAGPVATGVLSEDEQGTLWGIVVPLSGNQSTSARRVLLLFSDDLDTTGWRVAAGVFVAITGVVCLLALAVMTHWFGRRVVHPLQSLASFATWGRDPSGRMPAPDSQGYREMEQIGESLNRLVQGLTESDCRLRRVEREAKRQLLERQRGFNLKLRRAQDQASIDALTGLRNRGFLADELEPLIQRHQASGQDLGVVMIDVDNFKRHNDAFGHSAGDEVLSFIGDLLRAATRAHDYAVRYGGDEFLLLLCGASGPQAAKVAERVVKLFGQYASVKTGERGLSLSAGVASLKSNPDASGWGLIGQADKALYAAKRHGKNDVTTCAAL
jgi:diguanylate cyclase (GGDEF)-like protein